MTLYNHKLQIADMMVKREQGQPDYQDFECSQEEQAISPSTYDNLLKAHDQAKAFIGQLGTLRETPIAETLLNYCRELKYTAKPSQRILELMDNRLNKMLKNNRLKKNWSEDDLHILLWLLSKYMQERVIPSHQILTKHDWEFIASLIPGASPQSCMFKFVSLRKFKLAHHKWQKDQENLLFRLISQLGTSDWKTIAHKLYEDSPRKRIFRTAKQCREHWSCYLNPAIKKGPWQREEDRKLLQTVLDSHCQKKWSLIKEEFQGRTENALKNRYNLLIQKQKKITPLTNQIDLIVQNLKEDRDQTEDQRGRSEDGNTNVIETKNNTILPHVPIVPKEIRSPNQQSSYSGGYVLVFNTGQDFQSFPGGSWFYSL